MRQIIYIAFVILGMLMISPSNAQNIQQSTAEKKCPTAVPENIQTVSFCDLVRNPSRYDGKVVRIKAIYIIGAEVRAIYDRNCEGEAWVQYDYFYGKCTNEEVKDSLARIMRPVSNDSWPEIRGAEIVAVGLFVKGQGGFGHMNAYKYEFTIKWIEQVNPEPNKQR